MSAPTIIRPTGNHPAGPRRPPRRRFLSPRGPHNQARMVVLRILLVLLFGVLALRLWSLQVINSDHYKSVAQGQRVRAAVTPAARGMIVDDQGRPLVQNRASLVVTVDRSVLDRQPDKGEALLARVAKVLGTTVADLQFKTRVCGPTVSAPCWNGSPYQPIPVAQDVAPQQALEFIEHPDQYPGISADTRPIRTYPYSTMASHELGYVGPISDAELKKDPNRLRSDVVGLGGLEQAYDDVLRGKDGVKQVAVDRFGRASGEVSETAPQSGDTVVTAMDAQVQQVLENALQGAMSSARSAGYNAATASGVVLDVTNGQVVAMASFPTFDPSQFAAGISQQAYDQLKSPDAGTPLISRAYQGALAVGSTFKPFSLSAAVMNGEASLDGSYDCAPGVQVGGQTFHNFDGAAPGVMSLHQAIVVSCDTIFDKFAYDAWLQDGGLRNSPSAKSLPPPKEYFTKMARAYGFGRPSGIDLPGETAGLILDRAGLAAQYAQLKGEYCGRAKNGYPEVSDPATAARYKAYAQEACTDGYLYNGGAATQFGIGQGAYLQISPLQLATAYAAIANGGTVFNPRVAKAVLKPDGTLLKNIPPSVAGHLPVSPDVLQYIRDALGDVTRSGTASGAFGGFPLDQIHVGGKTGTAEVEGKGDTSWFASIGPLPNSKYAIVIDVPNTTQGAKIAAPAVRKVWEGIYGIGAPAALPGGQTPAALPTVRPDGSFAPPKGQGQ